MLQKKLLNWSRPGLSLPCMVDPKWQTVGEQKLVTPYDITMAQLNLSMEDIDPPASPEEDQELAFKPPCRAEQLLNNTTQPDRLQQSHSLLTETEPYATCY